MAGPPATRFTKLMMRRIVAAALWSYFGWYLAAHLASVFGLPLELAPAGGLLMLAIALLDRRWFTDRQGGSVQRVPSS